MLWGWRTACKVLPEPVRAGHPRGFNGVFTPTAVVFGHGLGEILVIGNGLRMPKA